MLSVTYADCLIWTLHAECHYAELCDAECGGAFHYPTESSQNYWPCETYYTTISLITAIDICGIEFSILFEFLEGESSVPSTSLH